MICDHLPTKFYRFVTIISILTGIVLASKRRKGSQKYTGTGMSADSMILIPRISCLQSVYLSSFPTTGQALQISTFSPLYGAIVGFSQRDKPLRIDNALILGLALSLQTRTPVFSWHIPCITKIFIIIVYWGILRQISIFA
jgi:hypothetical protein